MNKIDDFNYVDVNTLQLGELYYIKYYGESKFDYSYLTGYKYSQTNVDIVIFTGLLDECFYIFEGTSSSLLVADKKEDKQHYTSTSRSSHCFKAFILIDKLTQKRLFVESYTFYNVFGNNESMDVLIDAMHHENKLIDFSENDFKFTSSAKKYHNDIVLKYSVTFPINDSCSVLIVTENNLEKNKFSYDWNEDTNIFIFSNLFEWAIKCNSATFKKIKAIDTFKEIPNINNNKCFQTYLQYKKSNKFDIDSYIANNLVINDFLNYYKEYSSEIKSCFTPIYKNEEVGFYAYVELESPRNVKLIHGNLDKTTVAKEERKAECISKYYFSNKAIINPFTGDIAYYGANYVYRDAESLIVETSWAKEYYIKIDNIYVRAFKSETEDILERKKMVDILTS